MKGLIIWANSNCRSTTALYLAVQRQAESPVRIVLPEGNEGCAIPQLRKRAGFREDEFADVEMTAINGDYARGVRIMDECRGYCHLFCVYQSVPVYRQLIAEANRRGERVFVAGEAPCNMSSGWRWWMKEVYLRLMLRWKVKDVVNVAQKFICFSGDAHRLSALAGWPCEKVVPFGYFPPPIEGSKCVARAKRPRPFTILATGILSKYRGADVLVKALKILKDRGVEYRAIITQEGELLPRLKEMAERDELSIDFPGFLPMPKLIELYETCSVYVGAGRSEPWGMRLNDALNCGAPLVVSRGMGGVKLVDDYGCGLACRADDPQDMALQLEILAADENKYAEVAQNAIRAAVLIAPERQAQVILKECRNRGSMVA